MTTTFFHPVKVPSSMIRKLKVFEGYSVGDRIKVYFGPDNINNHTYTIRAFVDDQVVVKKGRDYYIWSSYYFDRLKSYMDKVK